MGQLSWLQQNGYRPVSIDEILAARDGGRPLPEKAVLLTFDDGYESFYTRVYPILKSFRFPAVLALVGSWLEGGQDTTVSYARDWEAPLPRRAKAVQFGNVKINRNHFLTWDQIREMHQSGLVEIASHSYGAHHGTLSDPQGNLEPDITTRRYDPVTMTYESDAKQQSDLDADSKKMADKIAAEIGKRPRVMVWPYGEYNESAMSIARKNGMPINFTLVDATAGLDTLNAVPRHLINSDPDLDKFVADLRSFTNRTPVRVVHVDLDYVYDSDPAQQERNIDLLVQRIHNLQINTVFLQAFAEPDGSGLVREVYFPNRLLPMRADLFNRVSWQLRTRALVQVFAWMPVLAFDFGGDQPEVLAWNPKDGSAKPNPGGYKRISPFDDASRRKVLLLYEDLARYAPFDGLLFHDDATLNEFEDASAPALAAYRLAGLPPSIEAIRADPRLMSRWTTLKTDVLLNFTDELAAVVRRYVMPLTTVRNIYANAVLEPDGKSWFAQDMDSFLARYDYTAIMAMPYMEGVPPAQSNEWIRGLVANVAARPSGLGRSIFELQSVDWRKQENGDDFQIPTEVLTQQMRLLLRLGALNFGYYPDDFVANHPNEGQLHSDFSLQSYPYLK